MKLSLEKGEVVFLEEFKETLSDGSAGGLELESVTFPICQKVVDVCVLVSEEGRISPATLFPSKSTMTILSGLKSA